MYVEYDRANPLTWPPHGVRVIVRMFHPYRGFPEYQTATLHSRAELRWQIAERLRPTLPEDSMITHWQILERLEP